jgi:hypothetical protein
MANLLISYISQSDLAGLGYALTSADTDAVNRIVRNATAQVETVTLRRFNYEQNIAERHQAYVKGGSMRIYTKQYPVVSVSNLTAYWTTYPASTINVTDSVFINNFDNYIECSLSGNLNVMFPYYGFYSADSLNKVTVSVTYTHGDYQTESYDIPAVTPFDVSVQDAEYGYYSTLEVTDGTTAYTSVAVSTPTVSGTYYVNDGVYTFASADAGKSIEITYSFIPEDIRQATILVAQPWLDDYFFAKNTGFAGINSIKDGNRAISRQDTTKMPDAAKEILLRNRRVR